MVIPSEILLIQYQELFQKLIKGWHIPWGPVWNLQTMLSYPIVIFDGNNVYFIGFVG